MLLALFQRGVFLKNGKNSQKNYFSGLHQVARCGQQKISLEKYRGQTSSP